MQHTLKQRCAVLPENDENTPVWLFAGLFPRLLRLTCFDNVFFRLCVKVLEPGAFLPEGAGQASKVIWSYTRPAWGAVSVAGVPFSPSTHRGNNFESTILKLKNFIVLL